MPKGWRSRERDASSSEDEKPDKIGEVLNAIEDSKKQVNLAIDKTIDRGDKLEDLEDKALILKDDAGIHIHRFCPFQQNTHFVAQNSFPETQRRSRGECAGRT